ncbi:unnamed protein product [Candidula unifasciata]|uniref:G-protein coupled receptors family 1 profile domain-containing protein n=1 Tax=Candidula unifasciata TaxID=100452 RepID=A0A8S3YX70_9EUPU|nr:unnamed protein product [Candidula unifasciata]
MTSTTTVFPNCFNTSTTTTIWANCTPPYNSTTLDDNVIWKPEVIQRVSLIIFGMVFSFVGNSLIILILTCSRHRKRNNRVNIFIVQLAIGDLSVCFCNMTTEILFVAFGQWVLGPALCKILTYIQCITLASTTFILTSMSFDRYLAICKPLKYRGTATKARMLIAISWILASILAIPQLLIFVEVIEEKDGRVGHYCKSKGYTAEWQRMLYISFLTCYVFVIPMILISFCYISIVCVVSQASRVVQNTQNNNCTFRRSGLGGNKSTFPRAKIKTLKMTFAIIATFIVCWTPYFVTTLIRVYSNYKISVPEYVMAVVETTTFIQSVVNPLIYWCFNMNIKRGIVQHLCPNVEQFDRRYPSYRTPGLCLSVSSGQAHHQKPVYEMKLCGNTRLQANINSNNGSNSDSGNSQDRLGRGSSLITVTEENKNGVRLRVRFASKEQCRCLSSDILNYCHTDISVPYDLLQQHSGPNSKMPIYKHHSLQQLYT